MQSLGRAEGPGLVDAVAHLRHRQRVGIRVGATLREGAEAAAGVADVGEVDVAVDDVADLVADRVAPHPVGEVGDRVEVAPSAAAGSGSRRR